MPSPPAGPAAFSDGSYGDPGCAHGEQPKDFLREQAGGLTPGEALCLAEGEERNAVHLAQLGHRALRIAAPWGWPRPRPRRWRAAVACRSRPATVIGMHLPPPLRARVLARAVRALRPGVPRNLEADTLRQLELGTGGPRRWIEQRPHHHGDSAVLQILGRKPR